MAIFGLIKSLKSKKTGKTTGEIVWEWHVWDHLIQEYDPQKENYGKVAEHPELIHINPIEWMIDISEEDIDQLKALGYISGSSDSDSDDHHGGPGGGNMFNPMHGDFNHTNAVSYNPELDQIALSVLGFSEIWVIDHSTTTKEAAGHTGGKRGKGGDLLYRWGNPMAYGAGILEDQQLFSQHDVQWIKPGLPGAGHLLVYNNGRGRFEGDYSSADEIVPPLDEEGNYIREPGEPFGPDLPIWTYSAPNKSDLYSPFLSSVQRLGNGNTLICSGNNGDVIEVTADGEKVWNYLVSSGGGFPFGPGGMGRPPMEMFDKDNDGKVSLEEAKEIPFFNEDMAKELDKDKDGFLSEDEFPAGPPPGMNFPGFPGGGPGGSPIDMFDKNNDEKLSLEETKGVPFFSEEFFKQQDKNSDGFYHRRRTAGWPTPRYVWNVRPGSARRRSARSRNARARSRPKPARTRSRGSASLRIRFKQRWTGHIARSHGNAFHR